MSVPRLFTIDEVAAITSAPRSSVQFWVYSGRLATLKPGRQRLVAEPELLRFLGIEDIAVPELRSAVAQRPRRRPARQPARSKSVSEPSVE